MRDTNYFSLLSTQACEYVAHQRRGRRPFLYRIWKFLQVTATEVIKGESKLGNILDENYFMKVCAMNPIFSLHFWLIVSFKTLDVK